MLKQIMSDIINKLIKDSKDESEIDAENVYKEANKNIRAIVDDFLKILLKRGSGVHGIENIEELYKLSQEGKSCLILSDHYSNFDIPVFFYLLKKEGLEHITDKVICMASTTLSDIDKRISAFAQGYARIIIYASRNLEKIKDLEKYEKEKQKSLEINRAALKVLLEKKQKGHIVFLFPAGTRYRKWDEDSKRGLAEIDGYLKMFDYFMPLTINGNVLEVSEQMVKDVPKRDLLLLKAGQVRKIDTFRKKIENNFDNLNDKKELKQNIINSVMDIIYSMHEELDEEKKKII